MQVLFLLSQKRDGIFERRSNCATKCGTGDSKRILRLPVRMFTFTAHNFAKRVGKVNSQISLPCRGNWSFSGTIFLGHFWYDLF